MKYLILLIAGFISGCATIVTGAFDDVLITSNPPGAKFIVQNKQGAVVKAGTTPQTVELKKGANYFSGQTYTVTYNLDKFYTQTSTVDTSLNPWYFGNIIFGGIIIGGIIVDPLTGAMWTLPDNTGAVLFPTD